MLMDLVLNLKDAMCCLMMQSIRVVAYRRVRPTTTAHTGQAQAQ